MDPALPGPDGDASEIEIRQVYETEDFGDAFSPELPSRNTPAGKGRGERQMRFVVFRKADDFTEAGGKPDRELLDAMMAYNRSMIDAGVLL